MEKFQKEIVDMSAYLIGHMTVKDTGKWDEYRKRVPSTLEPWGAKLIFRGQRSGVLAGEHHHTDTVVIQFPGSRCAKGMVHVQCLSSAYSFEERGCGNGAGELRRVSELWPC